MEFGAATDRMMAAGVTLQEMAKALRVAHTTMRAFRLDPGSDSYRRPPDGWKPKLAEFARRRGRALQHLANVLEGELPRRELTIDGTSVVFQIEQRRFVGTGGPPRPDEWLLTAAGGGHDTLLEKLGTGEYPERRIAEYQNTELERLWREHHDGD